jgi:hypothetical protein
MISLAGRDIQHNWAKFALTGLGLTLSPQARALRVQVGEVHA